MKNIFTYLTAIVMLLLVSAMSYGQKRIIFVGSAADTASFTRQSEIDLIDSISAWGFEVEYWSSARISAGELSTQYLDYDGIVVSEWIGSSAVNNLALDNYQIPIVNMEGWVHVRWEWVQDKATEFVQSSGGAEENNFVIIKDSDHYITSPYFEEDEVRWTYGDTIGAINQALINCTGAMESLVFFSAGLAVCKAHDEAFWTMMAIDEDELPSKVFLWGIVGMGLDGQQLGVHGGTSDFYLIIKRACQWAFDEMEPNVGVEEVMPETYEINVFPNPAQNRIIVRYESPVYGTAIAYLYSVTGQLVASFEKDAISGRNFIELVASDYIPGLYNLGIEIDGKTEFEKVVIQ